MFYVDCKTKCTNPYRKLSAFNKTSQFFNVYATLIPVLRLNAPKEVHLLLQITYHYL